MYVLIRVYIVGVFFGIVDLGRVTFIVMVMRKKLVWLVELLVFSGKEYFI